jgi:hypothetical protein
MKTSAAPTARPPARRRAKHADGLAFVDQGRTGTVVSDLRARLEEFYRRHPRRALKQGQPGIVEGLKSDRDRR